MNKKELTERDICTKYITPAVTVAGWDPMRQIREEYTFTAGRIIERGRLHARGKRKRADYLLFYKPNIPLRRRTVMALCERLETRLTQARADAERLTQAVLEEALAPATARA